MRTSLIVALSLAAAIGPGLCQAASVDRRSMDVPRWWTDVHVCWPENPAAGNERVIVGVEGKGSPDHEVFVLRATKWGDRLPDYVAASSMAAGVKALSASVEITPSRTVGYSDDWFDAFVLPDGARLTCNAVTEG